jgi:hypothetical protein
MKAALDSLSRAGEEALRWRAAVRDIRGRIMGKGYPAFSGGFTKAPFDVIGDSLRGTKGVMLDMFRYQDELKEACETAHPQHDQMRGGCLQGNRAHHALYPPAQRRGRLHVTGAVTRFSTGPPSETHRRPDQRGTGSPAFCRGGYNNRLEDHQRCSQGQSRVVVRSNRHETGQRDGGRVACLAGNVPTGSAVHGNTG